jgi:hypothetical protein
MPFFVAIFPPNFEIDRFTSREDEAAARALGFWLRGLFTTLKAAAAPNQDIALASESGKVSES